MHSPQPGTHLPCQPAPAGPSGEDDFPASGWLLLRAERCATSVSAATCGVACLKLQVLQGCSAWFSGPSALTTTWSPCASWWPTGRQKQLAGSATPSPGRASATRQALRCLALRASTEFVAAGGQADAHLGGSLRIGSRRGAGWPEVAGRRGGRRLHQLLAPAAERGAA